MRIGWRGAALMMMVTACAPADPPPTSPDFGPDGLYADFFDGKFDSLGHPVGAQVIDLPSGCASGSGRAGGDGWLSAAGSEPGEILCEVAAAVGSGPYAVNVRARAFGSCAGVACDNEALSIVVSSAGQTLAERVIEARQFDVAGELNLPVRFVASSAADISVRLVGRGPNVELDYVEVFRTSETVRIDPPSGPLPADGMVSIEYTGGSPAQAVLELECNGIDLGTRLASLVESGAARSEVGEFRALIEAPIAELMAECDEPLSLLVRAKRSSFAVASARASYGLEVPPCTFEDGTTRVLLTGFEPFPADASGDNSSREAVLAFDSESVPGISVMRMILPVEWDTAWRLVDAATSECRPDVVISFGQGRSAIDVETTAYNMKNTSAVAGGVPDNRGIIEAGTPIAEGGPLEVHTSLPAQEIAHALLQAGFEADTSTDPGRYICNNIFYEVMHNLGGDIQAAGFIHLARDPHIDEQERQRLGQVVTIALRSTLDL